MWEELWIAFALILVIEGIMPFLNPAGWRKTLRTVSEMDDKNFRIIGLSSMVFGVILLYLVHWIELCGLGFTNVVSVANQSGAGRGLQPRPKRFRLNCCAGLCCLVFATGVLNLSKPIIWSPDLCSTDFIGGYSHLTPSGLAHLCQFITPKV